MHDETQRPPPESERSGLLGAILTSAKHYAIIVISPAGLIETWNAGAREIFRYESGEIIGRPLEVLFTDQDRAEGVPRRELDTARSKGRADDYRWHRRKDGSSFWADGVLTPILDEQDALSGYVKILRDATEKHANELEISRLARVDPLTGLANRGEFDARFRDMTAAASRHHQLLILLLIDLDNFKQVNDRFGHQIGDSVLKQAATRMCDAMRKTDFVARLGGDEFVVLQPDAETAEVGGTVADKLIESLSQPFHVDGLEIEIGVSIGISMYPQDAVDPDQLLRKADLALYKVKDGAGNGYHYFSQELDYKAYKRSRELAAIRRAVVDKRFAVYYQPKINVVSDQVIAMEALLRCHEPVLAHYPVLEVIDLAVETGLMEQISLWVLQEATMQLKRWERAGLPRMKMCVNLSASELADENLPGRIADVLARSGIRPADLEVEVTEHQIFDGGEAGLEIISQLRATGVQVAIDDFGTGYSSLSYLNNLPIDMVKLDRSFLSDIPDDERACKVARSVVGLLHGLDLQIVVEGVETAQQAAFFQQEHCSLMQGFYFSRPMTAPRMSKWLTDHVRFSGGELDAPM